IHVEDSRGRTREVALPAGTGSFPGFTSPAQVVNDAGLVQFASDIPVVSFTLADFFRAAGIPFGKDRIGQFIGKPVTVKVNGVPVSTVEDTIVPPDSVIDISFGTT